jgi:trehalose 6-phosphate synthase/phosphatase
MANLIIVSNRLPLSVKRTNGVLEFYPSAGGLATGLASYASDKKNRWIGWPGMPSDDLTEHDKHKITRKMKAANCYPVFLTQNQLNGYYNGYSNDVLWPLMHNMAVEHSHRASYWKSYREVNTIFANKVMEHQKSGSMIWVHDYQLMLVPKMLRDLNSSLSIGFFLHIPFPDANRFTSLAESSRLIKGLLGSNVVGFHVPSYVNNFLETCNELAIGSASDGQVILSDRTVRVADFPIGIDYAKFADANKSRKVRHEVRKLRRKHRRQRVIVTVDRLDITKGFIERLQAYQTLLKNNPKLHRKVVMLMLAIPTRGEIKAYKDLRVKVEALVLEINRDYGTKRWKPIEYMHKTVPFEELSAMYQVADVAFVAPVRDGMNLVAKEYVASHTKSNGVLVLSETAGAAEELLDAVLVNPKQPNTLVKGLAKALNMPKSELKPRLSRMQKQLSTHTIHNWVETFMDTLEQPSIPYASVKLLSGKNKQNLIDAFESSKKRLLMLDYDGTLATFVDNPLDAEPDERLMKILVTLSSNPKTDVALISGRSQANLERWFGDLPITFFAEHGATMKSKHGEWKQLVKPSIGWKALLKPALEKHAANTPGAFVEEKEFALVWHYRTASPYHAQKNIVILRQALRPSLEKYGLNMHNGQKIIEIKPPQLNKGSAVARLLKNSHDFVFAIGDDYTDEDMFRNVPRSAFTVKVGHGKTTARYRINDVKHVQDLLKTLAGL